MSVFKGIKASQESQRDRHILDVRTPGRKFFDSFKNRSGTTVFSSITSFIVLLSIGASWMPGRSIYVWVAILCFPPLFLSALFRRMMVAKDTLPFRLPKEYGKIDYGYKGPTGKYLKASGEFFVGWCRETGRELWLSIKDVLTHILVLGTTGSGKTEVLIALGVNAFALGGGMSLVDPKADPKLGMQFFTLSRIFGRDDDLRILNFGTQGKNKYRGLRLTNTTNPLASQSAEGLTNLMVSLMSESEGANKVFAEKGITLVTSISAALCRKRDRGDIELSFGVLREYMGLSKAIELAEDETLGRYKDSLYAFLLTLGWQPGVPLADHGKALSEQYSYGVSYFSRTLTSLNETYGHIYDTQGGQVDMSDAIFNRRITIAMLPSLEKAPDEAANLGKITLTSQKEACAKALGDRVEGHADDILDSRPSFSRAPFLAITDEYEAIPTDGYEIIFTQGRSLNIIGILGTQSIPGLYKAAKDAAGQILECTKVKLVGQITSGTSAESSTKSTLEYFKEQAGEAEVIMSAGYHVDKDNPGMSNSRFRNKGDSNITSVSRLHKDDLLDQTEGQFHMFFQSRMVRGTSLYAAIEPKGIRSQLRIPRLIRVPIPNAQILSERFGRISEVSTAIFFAVKNKESEKIKLNSALKTLLDVYDHGAGISRQQLTPAAFIHWFTVRTNLVTGALGMGKDALPENLDKDLIPPFDADPDESNDNQTDTSDSPVDFAESMAEIEAMTSGVIPMLSEEDETLSPDEGGESWLSLSSKPTPDKIEGPVSVPKTSGVARLLFNNPDISEERVTAEDLLKNALCDSPNDAISDMAQVETYFGATFEQGEVLAANSLLSAAGMLSYPDPPKPDADIQEEILVETVQTLLASAIQYRLEE